ncbi:fluoride efflux transporter FluC [Zhihengliuella salsuginis]|uniref:Fluoride-specific ion channel n=1 Tax=Zhihengliuella salsuginis TaxID=578222 RepID=A0ABQ3GJ22_9MICC|nr:CrcB family protein [Zhihengliuella salsuginis]GHD08759.1 hypothetical protein GCM10008096_20740 [Zhihengliuella salsuginis]
MAAAGFAGTLLRYLLGLAFDDPGGPLASDPASLGWGTFAANVLGCLVLGLLTGWWDAAGRLHASGSGTVRLAASSGLLGSFTSFSAVAVAAPLSGLAGSGDTPLLWFFTGLTALSCLVAAASGLVLGRSMEFKARPELDHRDHPRNEAE